MRILQFFFSKISHTSPLSIAPHGDIGKLLNGLKKKFPGRIVFFYSKTQYHIITYSKYAAFFRLVLYFVFHFIK